MGRVNHANLDNILKEAIREGLSIDVGQFRERMRGQVETISVTRTHEALQKVTPADAFHGRQTAMPARHARIKQRMLQQRKRENLHVPPHAAIRSEVSL